MEKTYKIDHSRNIGTVLFVVEGGNENGGAELRLIKKIFTDILGFEMNELRRGTDEFIGYQGSSGSRVIGMNLPKNQIHKISDEDLDVLYQKIRDDLHLKPENYPLFFIYDRDYKSYKHNQLRKYVNRFTDPYSNDEGDRGQLLLSYPSVEAFIMSCFKDNTFQEKHELGTELKVINKALKYDIEHIQSDSDLIHAVDEMNAACAEFECSDYDIDNLSEFLIKMYDKQQQYYVENAAFSVLSQISMALLELGIIVEEGV